MSRINKSCRFVCHKWLLFAISFTLIYFDLMVILFSDTIASFYDHGHPDDQKQIYGTIMVESVISILFSIFGVIGAYRENYCCTVLFSIFMSISVVAEIYSSIIAPLFWFLTIFYVFVTMIAYSFARLIREDMIAAILEPQQTFMRDYGNTYGLRFNSYRFLNQNNNQMLQLETIEFDGRQLPPNYQSLDPNNNQTQTSYTLPPYEELPPYPPSYQESIRNKTTNNSNTDCVQHI